MVEQDHGEGTRINPKTTARKIRRRSHHTLIAWLQSAHAKM
jgi:hypothetical protein